MCKNCVPVHASFASTYRYYNLSAQLNFSYNIFFMTLYMALLLRVSFNNFVSHDRFECEFMAIEQHFFPLRMWQNRQNIASVWNHPNECVFFGVVCELDEIGGKICVPEKPGQSEDPSIKIRSDCTINNLQRYVEFGRLFLLFLVYLLAEIDVNKRVFDMGCIRFTNTCYGIVLRIVNVTEYFFMVIILVDFMRINIHYSIVRTHRNICNFMGEWAGLYMEFGNHYRYNIYTSRFITNWNLFQSTHNCSKYRIPYLLPLVIELPVQTKYFRKYLFW